MDPTGRITGQDEVDLNQHNAAVQAAKDASRARRIERRKQVAELAPAILQQMLRFNIDRTALRELMKNWEPAFPFPADGLFGQIENSVEDLLLSLEHERDLPDTGSGLPSSESAPPIVGQNQLASLDGFVTFSDMCGLFKIPTDTKAREAFRKRLGTFRHNHPDGHGWKEITDAKPREGRYLYQPGLVKQHLGLTDESSNEAPPKSF